MVHLSNEERNQIKTQNRCNKCNASFLNRATLAFHIRRVHQGVRTIVCDYCAKTYPTNASYQLHCRMVHQNERVQCQICGESLANRRTLTRHMLTRHDTTGPYHCEKCTYETMSLVLFKKHQMVHDVNRRRYPCQLCNKTFLRLKGLKEHGPVHTGIFLHECEWCEYACNSAQNLRKHRNKYHESALGEVQK